MVMKEHKRYFVLKSGDLIWWNEQPQVRPCFSYEVTHDLQDKLELTAQAVNSKNAGHIPLASILMVVRDELSVHLLAESGSTYSTKCTSVRFHRRETHRAPNGSARQSDEAEEWVKALNGAAGTTERSKREDKYGWVTYDDKVALRFVACPLY